MGSTSFTVEFDSTKIRQRPYLDPLRRTSGRMATISVPGLACRRQESTKMAAALVRPVVQVRSLVAGTLVNGGLRRIWVARAICEVGQRPDPVVIRGKSRDRDICLSRADLFPWAIAGSNTLG